MRVLTCLFVFGWLFSSCKSANEPTYFDLQTEVSGVLFDVFLDDTLGCSACELIVDGESVEVFEAGAFELSLLPGVYHMAIQSDYHENLDTLVTIGHSTGELALELENIWVDYFPTEVGNKWVYTGTENKYNPIGGDYSSTSRSLLIRELTDITVEDQRISYTGWSIYSDTTIIVPLYGPNPPDTVITADSSSFEIVFEDGKVEIDGEPYIDRLSSYAWREYGMQIFFSNYRVDQNRYGIPEGFVVPYIYPLNRVESENQRITLVTKSLIVENYVVLDSEVGVVEMKYELRGGHYTESHKWILKSFEKAED